MYSTYAVQICRQKIVEQERNTKNLHSGITEQIFGFLIKQSFSFENLLQKLQQNTMVLVNLQKKGSLNKAIANDFDMDQMCK